MPKSKFGGAHIRYLDLRYEEKAAVTYCRLYMTSDYTSTLREKFGWPEIPAGITSAKLGGSFTIKNLVLTPNGGKELKAHELQMGADQISDFQVFRTTDSESEAETVELRFTIKTSAADAEALAGDYLRAIGQGVGVLSIDYEEQSKLDLAEKSDDEEEDGPTLVDDEGEPVLRGAVAARHQMMQRGKAV